MTQQGICLLTSVPVRLDPDHKSQMVTQLIFGETYSVSESSDNWLKIMTTDDSYQGWIDLAQHTELTENEYASLHSSERFYSRGPVDGIVNQSNGVITILSAGSILYGKSQFSVAGTNFFFHGDMNQPDQNMTAESILECAESLIGAPYLWGGKTIMGYDCSGFVQIIFRMNGIILKRDASQQISMGTEIPFENSIPGDLAFFGVHHTVSHVGIISTENKIIHCSAKVRKDMIDQNGIISSDLQTYTHQLLSVRRII
jgi:gamma-D-glutamyl-L-lysine dipeptidyl-peptidase